MKTSYAIIADKDSKSWDFVKRVYSILKLKDSNCELIPLSIARFRDGEIKPELSKTIRRKNCFFIHDSNKNPSDWFLELNIINYILKDNGASEVIDILPYLRFARQDRKDMPRAPITAKILADSIQRYANMVVSLDIHNPAIQGFYDINFENLHSFSVVVEYLKEKYSEILDDLVIMSPDAGGAARAQKFANVLGSSDVVMGYKSRDKPGEISGLKVLGEVSGKNVMIVDDMIDSGGTMIAAANELRKQGAKLVYAYCTHGLFTKGTSELTDAFDKIFVADTLEVASSDKIEVISFDKLFAEAIYRINEGVSLSELFVDK